MTKNKWLNALPQKWHARIALHLKQDVSLTPRVSASDFKRDLRILFEDGSHAFFKYAFYLIDEDAREIAVLTEHCGYHIFPYGGTELEIVD